MLILIFCSSVFGGDFGEPQQDSDRYSTLAQPISAPPLPSKLTIAIFKELPIDKLKELALKIHQCLNILCNAMNQNTSNTTPNRAIQ